MTTLEGSSSRPAPTFLHRTERGELRMTMAAPTVLLMQYKGYSDEGFVDFIEGVWDQTFANAPYPVQVFADTEDQTGYASAFQLRLMKWSRGMVARTDAYCLLVKSRWVAMGIAIVRSAVGRLAAHAEVTTSREAFDAKLRAAVQRSLARHSA